VTGDHTIDFRYQRYRQSFMPAQSFDESRFLLSSEGGSKHMADCHVVVWLLWAN
jgi:hypothetical protein